MSENNETLSSLMGLLFRAHPWHGVPIGERARRGDGVHRDVAHRSGEIRTRQGDGPSQSGQAAAASSTCPTLYGLVP